LKPRRHNADVFFNASGEHHHRRTSESNIMTYEVDQAAEVTAALQRIADEAKTSVDCLRAEVREFEQKHLQSPGAYGGGGGGGPTLGAQVAAKLAEHSGEFGRTKSLRLEGLNFSLKAAGDPVTTADTRTVISAGIGSPAASFMGVQNAFPQRNLSGTSAVEYSRYVGTTGAALVVKEGVAKPPVKPDFVLVQQSALTIAAWTKASRQAVADASELGQVIDVTLQRACAKALDLALTGGSVDPAFPGLLALATATTSLVYTALPDAVSEAFANMQMNGFLPDTMALGPLDWLGITTAKNAQGDYLAGSYLGILPEAMRGLKVIFSPSLPAGKALLLDSGQLDLAIVDGFAVELAYSGDDFTKNLITVLGEMRVIPTFRSVGAAALVTPKAVV
jgi:HK97 family phage major capsid protein